MKKVILLLAIIGISYGCSHREKKKTAKSVKVKCYKQHSSIVDNDPTNDWIFWYLIMNNNGGCNYYSSTSPVSNYSSVSWSKADRVPEELADKEQVQEQPEQEVEVDDLAADMQAEIDATPENYQGMTYEELGDYENSTQDIDNQSDNSTTESGSDNSGSESGGGDSGGGDSGGGGDGGFGGGGGGGFGGGGASGDW